MTIREIAQAAGVSPATVSKVINGHDESIAPDTRKRVLQIVKETNYSPYAKVSARASRLLGVILREGNRSLLEGISEEARKEGYCTIVYFSGNGEDDVRSFQLLQSHHADGIIWEPGTRSPKQKELPTECQSIPCVRIDPRRPNEKHSMFFDMAACAEYLTEELIRAHHSRIVCFADGDFASAKVFEEGYRRVMLEHGLQPAAHSFADNSDAEDARLFHSTAAVCDSCSGALKLMRRLRLLNISVPDNFSVAALRRGDDMLPADAMISYMELDDRKLGRSIVRRIVGRIEKESPAEEPLVTYAISSGTTMRDVNALRNARVLVVGALNMDTLLSLPATDKPTASVAVTSRTVVPGGKALNQAVACRKLEADVNLIGYVGNDYEGSAIHRFLQGNGIPTTGVSVDPTAATGYACITINADGESSVFIDRGANNRLSCSDIDRHEDLFRSIGFCLLQTELDTTLALHCARLAHKYGARVILKPCNQPELTDELLKTVDFLIPNHHELDAVCPGPGTLEEKAERLLQRGTKCVIVTRGSRGSYLTDGLTRRYFPAAAVHVVDTTGACDSFAAALAVFLMHGETTVKAIEYATCAAGLSTEKCGVPTAVPDLAAVIRFYYDHWQTNTTTD